MAVGLIQMVVSGPSQQIDMAERKLSKKL